MLKFRHLFMLLMLASPLAGAMNALFWQPQLRDNSVTQTQWASLMENLHQQGFDTLVLQWTQYGDAFAGEQDRLLLQQRAKTARAAGLKVIVGLHGDPEFFDRQKQTGAARSHYLQRLRVADLHQAKLWNAEFQPDGWYLSAEIDDLNWRNPEARAQLVQWMNETRQQMKTVSPQPLYISSFFAGNMSPDGYRELVNAIQQTGINVWVQDGHGVSSLTPVERQRYLDESAGCAGPASGTVYELFNVVAGKTFNATPLPAKEMAAQLAQKNACDKDRIFFSLRYLPAASGILEWRQ